ncbi:MAG: hypothetical protein PHD81_02180 [Candidatus Nanoarchaeia archaeon]|nr:hypothetical protein [Candidatus Nanoarchaeia archaeon]MDD5587898.1 hypothetical protein [Candidatus Nanoarchaeia archaeon]
MNKKAQELPIKTIIVLILALIVFIVLIILFGGGSSKIISKILGIISDTIGTAGAMPKA